MSDLFRSEVLNQQQSRLDGCVSLVRPVRLQWLSLLLAAITITALIFMVNAQYRRKQTVHGVLMPQAGVIKLAADNQGLLDKVLIKEGERVTAGQPLMELARPQFDSHSTEVGDARIQQAQANIVNLQDRREQLVSRQTLEIQLAAQGVTSLSLQQKQLQEQLQTLQQRLQLNRQQLTQLQTLTGSGYISTVELTRQKDQILSLEQQQAMLMSQSEQLRAEMQQATTAQLQLPSRHKDELNRLDEQISSLQLLLTERSLQAAQVIVAPKAGIVGGLQLKEGQMVRAGQALLSLTPVEPVLEAVMYLPSRAAAFVTVGQQARLRYHAYPYQRFGIFTGELTEISSAVLLPAEVSEIRLVEPAFQVRIRLPAQQVSAYQRQFPLKAGMMLDADIVTEEMTLWQWLFDPILSLQGRF